MDIPNRTQQAAGQARSAGHQAEQSTAFRVLVTVGLCAYGLVHLLIAWIALQVAWSGSQDEASQQGAFAELAGNSFGSILLWICAVGLFTLVIWQIFEAAWGHRNQTDDGKRTRKRLGSVARAVVYGALGVSAATTAAAGKKSGGGDQKEESMTADLLASTFGQVLVVAIGLVILGVGVKQVRRGITKHFTDDLDTAVDPKVIRLGQIGFIAKGTVLGLVGALFIWAALSYDPEKAGGMDDALRTLREQPFGQILLTLVALGLAAFGAYCFVWARHPRR